MNPTVSTLSVPSPQPSRARSNLSIRSPTTPREPSTPRGGGITDAVQNSGSFIDESTSQRRQQRLSAMETFWKRSLFMGVQRSQHLERLRQKQDQKRKRLEQITLDIIDRREERSAQLYAAMESYNTEYTKIVFGRLLKKQWDGEGSDDEQGNRREETAAQHSSSSSSSRTTKGKASDGIRPPVSSKRKKPTDLHDLHRERPPPKRRNICIPHMLLLKFVAHLEARESEMKQRKKLRQIRNMMQVVVSAAAQQLQLPWNKSGPNGEAKDQQNGSSSNSKLSFHLKSKKKTFRSLPSENKLGDKSSSKKLA